MQMYQLGTQNREGQREKQKDLVIKAMRVCGEEGDRQSRGGCCRAARGNP